jgi:homocysteine S-methyltransferase
VVVLDGGLATALEGRGHTLGSALWSAQLLIEDPEAIREAHRAYLRAGADCITSSSYQASFEGFADAGLTESEAESVLRRSSHIALSARDDFVDELRSDSDRLPPLVAASVGPYGAYLADGSEYNGRYGVSTATLDGFHRRRLGVLATTGIDMIACETIPRVDEVEILLDILEEHPDTCAWVSVSCRDGQYLSDGSSFEDVVRLCSGRAQVAAVGVNCTDPRYMAELMARASEVTDLPLIAYPNSGESYDAENKDWVGGAGGAEWLSGVRDSLRAGACVVGGCCRIGPESVEELRRVVEGRHWMTGVSE